MGRYSSDGIGTRYGLDSWGSNPGWGARLSAPVQNVPGAHPASCTMDTSYFSRGLSSRGVALTTHPHLAPRLKKEQTYNLYAPSLPSWPVKGEVTKLKAYLYHSNEVLKWQNRRQIACPDQHYRQPSTPAELLQHKDSKSMACHVNRCYYYQHGIHYPRQSQTFTCCYISHKATDMFERNEQPSSAERPGRPTDRQTNRSHNNIYISVPGCPIKRSKHGSYRKHYYI